MALKIKKIKKNKKKTRWVKGSLVEAIIPSGGTQPSARLQRDETLPCKVVITSTHALPRHPRGFPIVKALTTLSIQQSTKVHIEWYRCIPKSYKAKTKKETH